MIIFLCKNRKCDKLQIIFHNDDIINNIYKYTYVKHFSTKSFIKQYWLHYRELYKLLQNSAKLCTLVLSHLSESENPLVFPCMWNILSIQLDLVGKFHSSNNHRIKIFQWFSKFPFYYILHLLSNAFTNIYYTLF